MDPSIPTRRHLLKSAACGFGYLAFAGLAAEAAAAAVQRPATQPAVADGSVAPGSPPRHYVSPLAAKTPHFASAAKRVIFLFMQGGPSHVDTFDYKPQLIADDGKAGGRGKLMAPQWKFQQYGKSGLWISDLFPNVARHADDLCLVRSMHCDNPAHPQATIQLHTGTATFVRPSMGAWVLYGLGTTNQNLPGFITINPPGGLGGAQNYGSGFLPAAYQGTRLDGDGSRALPNVGNRYLSVPNQRRQLDLVQEMNRDLLARAGDNQQIEGLIESYELGFRMQSAVPDLMELSREPQDVLDLYGIGSGSNAGAGRGMRAMGGGGSPDTFGRQCLLARRFAEAGVRFIEVCHAGWDQHNGLRQRHAANAAAVDKPIAGLLEDLKRRDLLKDTLVVWGGEFGRTPTSQQNDGRDHNHRGYTMWLAGGGIKGGLAYGATDEHGAAAAEDPVHVHDLHATILNQLGLDHTKLTYRYAGRDFRLTDVHGNVVREIIA
jgi:hypothetical protein